MRKSSPGSATGPAGARDDAPRLSQSRGPLGRRARSRSEPHVVRDRRRVARAWSVGARGRTVEAHSRTPHEGIERLAVLTLGTLLKLGVDVHGHLGVGVPDLAHHPGRRHRIRQRPARDRLSQRQQCCLLHPRRDRPCDRPAGPGCWVARPTRLPSHRRARVTGRSAGRSTARRAGSRHSQTGVATEPSTFRCTTTRSALADFWA